MANNLREIRGKMKSVKSTRQVTKAMELVSASKMRRALQNAQQLRRYAEASWNVLHRVAAQNAGVHPFLAERSVRKVLVIVFSSDRGLTGGLNSHLFRLVAQYVKGLQKMETFERLDFIAVGRKAQQFLARTGQNVIAAFPAVTTNPTVRTVSPIVRLANESFVEGTYDHIAVIYADCVSAMVQEPTVKMLLPFSESAMNEMIESMLTEPRRKKETVITKQNEKKAEYTFEPSPSEVLDTILPQITEIQVYQALLESIASEHSARMVAMRNATDNASALLDDMTLTCNRTRQAIVTSELAELSASKAALE